MIWLGVFATLAAVGGLMARFSNEDSLARGYLGAGLFLLAAPLAIITLVWVIVERWLAG